MSFPIEYQIPSNKKLENQPTAELTAKMRGKGFDILLYKLRRFKPLRLDLSNLPIGNSKDYSWSTKSEAQILRDELPEALELLDVQPDTIRFMFSEMVQKKVAVYLDAEYTLEGTRALYKAPRLFPDSITVEGPEADLEKLDSIFTEPLVLEGDKDTIFRKVALTLPENELLRFSQKNVEMGLRYTDLTEGSREVGVEVLHIPEGFRILLFPEKVTVTFQVPLDDFDRVSAADFAVYTDFDQLVEREGAQILPVFLSSFPAYLRQIRIEPSQLEFILTEE